MTVVGAVALALPEMVRPGEGIAARRPPDSSHHPCPGDTESHRPASHTADTSSPVAQHAATPGSGLAPHTKGKGHHIHPHACLPPYEPGYLGSPDQAGSSRLSSIPHPQPSTLHNCVMPRTTRAITAGSLPSRAPCRMHQPHSHKRYKRWVASRVLDTTVSDSGHVPEAHLPHAARGTQRL